MCLWWILTQEIFSLLSTNVNFLCQNIFYLFITFFTFRGYSRCFLIFDQPWNIPQIDEVIFPFYLNGFPTTPSKTMDGNDLKRSCCPDNCSQEKHFITLVTGYDINTLSVFVTSVDWFIKVDMIEPISS